MNLAHLELMDQLDLGENLALPETKEQRETVEMEARKERRDIEV